MVWYYYPFKNFPLFIVIHTVKGFSIVSEAEVDVLTNQSPLMYECSHLIASHCYRVDTTVFIFQMRKLRTMRGYYKELECGKVRPIWSHSIMLSLRKNGCDRRVNKT